MDDHQVQDGPKVSHYSHFFGGIGGLLTGVFLLEDFNQNSGIKKISIFALILYILLVATGIGYWYHACEYGQCKISNW